MAQAEAESSPDGRRGWRAAAIAAAGAVVLGLLGAGGAVGREGPRPLPLAEGPLAEAPLEVPFDDVPPAPTTTSTSPGTADSAPATPPPPAAEAQPVPSAAGPPTTVTTARRVRSAPQATTTTTAAGTVESRGAAALALIDYPWQRTGYGIVFAGPNDKLLGLTEPSRKRITIYLRPTQTTGDVARILGHEIGHAVDFTMTTDAERADYRRIRGLDNRPWYPGCGSCADYASPVGDWAETFAYWLLGNGSFNSQLAGKPTAAQLKALIPVFTADPAPPTTPTTKPAPPAPTPTTTTTIVRSGGTTTPDYGYGGGYRRMRRR